jgi:hypothetical protein
MSYKKLHDAWLNSHLKRRKGERLGRLQQGYKHGEDVMVKNIIYPLIGALDDLHPEYEVVRLNGRTIYIDVALIRGNLKIAFELDGYASHAREINRERFAWDRRRDLLLQSEGWVVIRMATDDLNERASELRELVRRRLATCFCHYESYQLFNPMEREVIRLAIRKGRGVPFRLGEVAAQLEVCADKARSILRKLVNEKVVLVQGEVSKRIHYYQLNSANERVRRWVSGT